MGASISAAQATILVVDDNRDVCAFMAAALEKAGYGVRTATDGADAVGQMRSNRADLLITDIFMPVQEGMETIAICRSEFPQTRIIAMSAGGGTGRTDFLTAAELLGADAALRKPFSADELLVAVRKALPPG